MFAAKAAPTTISNNAVASVANSLFSIKKPLVKRPFVIFFIAEIYLLAYVDSSDGTTVESPSDCHICIPPR